MECEGNVKEEGDCRKKQKRGKENKLSVPRAISSGVLKWPPEEWGCMHTGEGQESRINRRWTIYN